MALQFIITNEFSKHNLISNVNHLCLHEVLKHMNACYGKQVETRATSIRITIYEVPLVLFYMQLCKCRSQSTQVHWKYSLELNCWETCPPSC